MTIIVGFHCVDGIMLCADTQETVHSYLKRKQPKLVVKGAIYPLNQSPCATFAGATTDGDFADALVDKLWRAMEPEGPNGLEAMITVAERVLTDEYQRLTPLFPSGVPEVELLVGVWAALNEFELVKIKGPVLKRDVVADAIGIGDILATYLLSRLLWVKTWLNQAKPVGVYIIDQAKEHVDSCGGETQLVTMDYKGEVERHFNDDYARQETERLRSVDEVARKIVGLGMDRYESKENFSRLLEEACKPLYDIVKINPPHEQISEDQSEGHKQK